MDGCMDRLPHVLVVREAADACAGLAEMMVRLDVVLLVLDSVWCGHCFVPHHSDLVPCGMVRIQSFTLLKIVSV